MVKCPKLPDVTKSSQEKNRSYFLTCSDGITHQIVKKNSKNQIPSMNGNHVISKKLFFESHDYILWKPCYIQEIIF